MDRLENVFRAYREALPDPEPSASFTPGIWKRIEARRSPIPMIRRMTEALVAISALTALVLGMVLIPRMQSTDVYNASYIDVLAAEHVPETLAYAEVVHPEVFPETNSR